MISKRNAYERDIPVILIKSGVLLVMTGLVGLLLTVAFMLAVQGSSVGTAARPIDAGFVIAYVIEVVMISAGLLTTFGTVIFTWDQ